MTKKSRYYDPNFEKTSILASNPSVYGLSKQSETLPEDEDPMDEEMEDEEMEDEDGMPVTDQQRHDRGLRKAMERRHGRETASQEQEALPAQDTPEYED